MKPVETFSLFLVAIVCLFAVGQVAAQPISTQCWSVTFSPQKATAQPNNHVMFSVKIVALKDTYDSNLQVFPGQYAKVPSNATVKVPQLTTGQSFEQPFEVVIGSDAPAGETDIHILVEGHDDPSVSGLFRWPWDKPECVADSRQQSFNPFVIQVLRKPSLFVNVSIPATVGAGEDFDLSIVVRNNGTETAKNVIAKVSLPSGISSDQSQAELGGIAQGADASYHWRLHAVTNGTYQIKVQVIAANAEPVQGLATVTVEFRSAIPPLMVSPLIFVPRIISLLVIIGLIFAGIVEIRQGHVGRPGIALNVFFLWQVFFEYWARLPNWFQVYLDIGSIVAVIALISYFKRFSLPGQFYNMALIAFGSFSVIAAVIVSYLIGVSVF